MPAMRTGQRRLKLWLGHAANMAPDAACLKRITNELIAHGADSFDALTVTKDGACRKSARHRARLKLKL